MAKIKKMTQAQIVAITEQILEEKYMIDTSNFTNKGLIYMAKMIEFVGKNRK